MSSRMRGTYRRAVTRLSGAAKISLKKFGRDVSGAVQGALVSERVGGPAGVDQSVCVSRGDAPPARPGGKVVCR